MVVFSLDYADGENSQKLSPGKCFAGMGEIPKKSSQGRNSCLIFPIQCWRGNSQKPLQGKCYVEQGI